MSVPEANPQQTVAELQAQLQAAEAEAQQQAEGMADPTATPVLDALASQPVTATPQSFLTALRAVAQEFTDSGKLSEADRATTGEEGELLALLVKLVGELVKTHTTSGGSVY